MIKCLQSKDLLGPYTKEQTKIIKILPTWILPFFNRVIVSLFQFKKCVHYCGFLCRFHTLIQLQPKEEGDLDNSHLCHCSFQQLKVHHIHRLTDEEPENKQSFLGLSINYSFSLNNVLMLLFTLNLHKNNQPHENPLSVYLNYHT